MTSDIDIEDYSLPEYIAMHIISKGPVFKSQVIRQAIRDFGDIIENVRHMEGWSIGRKRCVCPKCRQDK